jgi:hypothetical protein
MRSEPCGHVQTEIVNLVSAAIATGQSARAIANLHAVHPSATEALVRALQRHFERPRAPDRPTGA